MNDLHTYIFGTLTIIFIMVSSWLHLRKNNKKIRDAYVTVLRVNNHLYNVLYSYTEPIIGEMFSHIIGENEVMGINILINGPTIDLSKGKEYQGYNHIEIDKLRRNDLDVECFKVSVKVTKTTERIDDSQVIDLFTSKILQKNMRVKLGVKTEDNMSVQDFIDACCVTPRGKIATRSPYGKGVTVTAHITQTVTPTADIIDNGIKLPGPGKD